jgi:DNA-binding NtrC family response regulator
MHRDVPTPHITARMERALFQSKPIPGLLRAYGPPTAQNAADLVEIPTPLGLCVGREPDPDVAWPLDDLQLSKRHLRLTVAATDGACAVTDLGSTNGTFVQGEKIRPHTPYGLKNGHVIRCGQTVLVFQKDLRPIVARQTDAEKYGLVGRFHSPVVLGALADAVSLSPHILLSGDSGTGKELAVHALYQLWNEIHPPLNRQLPFVACNCARFATAEEAKTSLFGIRQGVFSGVAERKGLLACAEDGLLFLDEFHLLSSEVQRSLLRFVEDGSYTRIGETTKRTLEVRIVFTTNIDVQTAVNCGTLAFDLVNRLRRIHLPPLNDRRADVVDIFCHHLRCASGRFAVDHNTLIDTLTPTHFEALVLLDFVTKNARLLVHLAEELVWHLAQSDERDAAFVLGRLLAQTHPHNPVIRRSLDETAYHDAQNTLSPAVPLSPTCAPGVMVVKQRRGWGRSRYERNKKQIIACFHECGHNVSATVRELKRRNIPVSRRWLAKYLRRWGER